MKFLANENFPKPSIDMLRNNGCDVLSISEIKPGSSDEVVMQMATSDNRTILTHDSDYGTLVYKYGYRPSGGVVYLRLGSFEPSDPGIILLDLIQSKTQFESSFTVVGRDFLRQRKY